MAKKPNDKSPEHGRKKNRNVNRATVLLLAGLAAEAYLLLINTYFVGGTVGQVLAANSFLQVMTWVGLAAAIVGAALLFLRGKKEGFARWGGWLLGCGAFFAFSSVLMRKIYGEGTTAMCILVPVLMVLGIIALLYPGEFAVESTALVVSIAALVLLSSGADKAAWAALVRVCAALAIAAVLLMTVCVLLVRKNGGMLGTGAKSRRVFEAQADYRLVFLTLGLCLATVALALIVPAAAFYGVWLLAALTFCLAVYYTIRLL